MRRLLSVGAATAFALLVVAPFTGVANAQTTPTCTTDTAYTAPSTLAVAPSVVEEGGVIQATGCGTPGATQTFKIGATVLGTTVTGANGVFSASLPVPCGTEEGRHTLTASEPSGRSQSAALTVDGVTGTCVGAGGAARQAGGGGGGALPRTGTASLAPLTAAGVGLVLIGGFAVTAARRRRTSQAIGS